MKVTAMGSYSPEPWGLALPQAHLRCVCTVEVRAGRYSVSLGSAPDAGVPLFKCAAVAGRPGGLAWGCDRSEHHRHWCTGLCVSGSPPVWAGCPGVELWGRVVVVGFVLLITATCFPGAVPPTVPPVLHECLCSHVRSSIWRCHSHCSRSDGGVVRPPLDFICMSLRVTTLTSLHELLSHVSVFPSIEDPAAGC